MNHENESQTDAAESAAPDPDDEVSAANKEEWWSDGDRFRSTLGGEQHDARVEMRRSTVLQLASDASETVLDSAIDWDILR